MADYQTGIDIKRDQSGNLVMLAFLLDSGGAVVTSGTTNVYIVEVQSDGSFKTLDWDDYTFKSGTCTTAAGSATHRPANNGAKDLGLWSVVLSSAQQADFDDEYQYVVIFENSNASPTLSPRWFQWGGTEGAAASDAELTAAHGTGSWQTGTWPGTGINTVDLTLLDGSSNPVTGQICVVRNSAESAIVAFGFTDANGEIGLQLDDGTYKVRYGGYYACVAGGVGLYSFSNPYTLTVSGDTSATHTCTALSMSTGGLTFAEMRGMLEIFIMNTFEERVANTFSRALMGQLINTGYHDLGQKLRWRRDECLVDINADDYQYDIAISSRNWDLVEYYDSSSDQHHVLTPITLQQWREKMIDSDATGVPRFYARFGDQLRLHPTPDDDDDTLTIHGIVDVADLTADDETPEFPPHTHPLIVDLAIARAWRLAGNSQMADITESAADRQVFQERAEDTIRRTSGRLPPPEF